MVLKWYYTNEKLPEKYSIVWVEVQTLFNGRFIDLAGFETFSFHLPERGRTLNVVRWAYYNGDDLPSILKIKP